MTRSAVVVWLRKFIYLFIFSANVSAGLDDYSYPYKDFSVSNYGTIGIIQNPNARFLPSGSLGFSWTHNEPYLRGSLLAYPFEWFEASYQYADINNTLYSKYREFSGSQSLKDKSFDAKFRLFKESYYFPQLAAGFRDLAGTGLFSAEYIAASKFLTKSLDVTFGLGWGRLNGNSIKNPFEIVSDRFKYRTSDLGKGGKINLGDYFSGQAGYFAGLEYYVKNFYGLRVKLEYDGTNYITEGRKPISQKSNYNFGLSYPQSKNLSFKLNYVRGNTINFGFAYQLRLGKKNSQVASKEKQKTIDNQKEIKFVASKSEDNLYKVASTYLRSRGIFLQHAIANKSELHVVVAQSQYRNPIIASGRALQVLDEVLPAEIKDIKISEINGGLGMYTVDVNRENYTRGKKNFVPLKIDSDLYVSPYEYSGSNDYKFNPKPSYPSFFHSIGPELRSQIGGPDGFFFGDLKVKSSSELLLRRNLSIISDITYGVYDNMDDLKLASDSILPHVRTDIVKYLKSSRNLSIQRMQFNYFGQLQPSLYYKLSGGILEPMFNGVGGEVLYKPFSKNFAVGVEAWRVIQRDYDQMFTARDYSTSTGHISLYYTEPISAVTFRLKGGRYLAKDSGVTFESWRTFDSGFRLGAFFTLTDISEEEFGEGSFDKGFYFHLPIEIFTTKHSKRRFGWGLTPLTRDGGASLIHSHPLWGVLHAAEKQIFVNHIDNLYD
ncbi:YjbH domain-containing protein [Gammaproteobacteria bacterium]|nr:YjbH domain-containing protein [Gammaproteobacteria bacterium]